MGAIVDVVRLMKSFHSPQYQYIPALSLPRSELNLRLNNPPSFRNPKSVLVIGLPPIAARQFPPLRAVDANEVFCPQKPGLVLPADGAPLVFSDEMAHHFVLHVDTKSGPGIDLPAVADPARGGFVVETQGIQSAELDGEVSGTLRGLGISSV